MREIKLNLRHYELFPPHKFNGEVEKDAFIDLDETAFVIVDVYGTGFSEEDSLVRHAHPSLNADMLFEAEKDIIINHILPARDAARKAMIPIIYISNSGPKICLENSELNKQLKRTEDQDLRKLFEEDNVDSREYHYGKENSFLKFSKVIEPGPDDYFIRKFYYSGFYETRLESLLKNLGIKTIIYTGFAADVCLLATMLDGLNRNYESILLRDCTLAIELPEEIEELAFTNRMVTYTECYIGRTTLSKTLIKALE